MIIDDTDDESVSSFHVISDTYKEDVKEEIYNSNDSEEDGEDKDVFEDEEYDEDKAVFEDDNDGVVNDDGGEVNDDVGKSGVLILLNNATLLIFLYRYHRRLR